VDELKPDCAESLKELYAFLDGELTGDRRTHIKAHLFAAPGGHDDA